MGTENEKVSSARIIAGIASFFAPGLGQLLLGKFKALFLILLLTVCFWTLGILLLSPIDGSIKSYAEFFFCIFLFLAPNITAAYFAANDLADEKQKSLIKIFIQVLKAPLTLAQLFLSPFTKAAPDVYTYATSNKIRKYASIFILTLTVFGICSWISNEVDERERISSLYSANKNLTKSAEVLVEYADLFQYIDNKISYLELLDEKRASTFQDVSNALNDMPSFPQNSQVNCYGDLHETLNKSYSLSARELIDSIKGAPNCYKNSKNQGSEIPAISQDTEYNRDNLVIFFYRLQKIKEPAKNIKDYNAMKKRACHLLEIDLLGLFGSPKPSDDDTSIDEEFSILFEQCQNDELKKFISETTIKSYRECLSKKTSENDTCFDKIKKQSPSEFGTGYYSNWYSSVRGILEDYEDDSDFHVGNL